MNAVANVIQFPAEHPVDRLGALKAQIAELEREADAIADSLRAQGKGTYEGSLFKASVSDEALVQTFDTAAAKALAQSIRPYNPPPPPAAPPADPNAPAVPPAPGNRVGVPIPVETPVPEMMPGG